MNISHIILKISSKIGLVSVRVTIILLLSLLSINASSSVNKIDFLRITSNSGLSSEEIRNIFQDNEGYMWFLTPEGLNKYDGYNFKIYKKNFGDIHFPTSAFECVCEDSLNRIWLGTAEQGIVIFDTHSNELHPFEDISSSIKLPEKSIRSLMYDRNNNVWIGTENGLYLYHTLEDSLQYYNLANFENPLPEWCIIEDIVEDERGNVWIATWNEGLFVYDYKEGTFRNFKLFDADKSNEQNNQIKSIFQDKFGFVWIGTWEDGLYKTLYKNGEVLINNTFLFSESDKQGILGNIIYSINQDINGNMWIGTPYGLSIIEHSFSTKNVFHSFKYLYGSKNGLSNNEIWKIYKDKSGMMWLGTLEGGINMAHPNGQIFESYTIPPVSQQIQSQTIQTFMTDPNDQLLIGVKSLGFGYYDLNKKKYIPYIAVSRFDSLPRDINTVNCFLKIKNEMWMGTRYNGIGIYNYKTKQFSSIQGTQMSYDIRALYLAKDGVVWAGASDGLYRISTSKSGAIDIEFIEAFNSIKVTSICEDDDNNLWIGTAENGICRINGESKGEHFFSRESSSISDEITSIFKDKQHTLWVGTNDKGLIRYNPENETFEGSDVLRGLSDVAIMGITDDELGNLWVTTNNGIARIIQTNGEFKTDKYTISDGLQGNRFVPNSVYKLSDSRILMGGYYGFNAFYPRSIKENVYIPPTVLTAIKINDEIYDDRKLTKRIFKHNESSFTFEFSSLSYYKSEKNIYSYMLEGLDQNWIITSAATRDVRYPKLPAGNYNFLVLSANSSEVWNEEPVSFKFKIQPAPYKTWWAYSVYLIVFFTTVFLIFRYQLQKQEIIRNLEIEKIQHEKTEKLNEYKLHFFTNISHEILTPLSIIMGAVGILKKKTRKGLEEIEIMERNLLGLKQLLRQLLDFRKMERGHLNLKVREGNLVTVIQSIVINFKPLLLSKSIAVHFESPDELTCFFDEDKLNKICQNLISNAIKYTAENGRVKINLVKENDKVILSIEDNGFGISEKDIEGIFNRFYRSDVTKRESGTGIGLALVNNLVKLHKGSIEVSSTLGKGTIFTIYLPVSKTNFEDHEFELDNLDSLKDEDEDLGDLHFNNISILLVEDNSDFRAILRKHLETIATIIESPSGDDALRKAIKYAPSIVVSDVMMPNMNGYELCVQLKSNVDTQHIPVILLTAKTTDVDRAKGYGCGADSYITKPVSLSVLQTRIHSLLQKNRNKASLPEGYKVFRAPNIAISDEAFLEKLQDLVEVNLSDIDFKVPNMHQPFGMSSSAFFRKVKQLTNMSPVEYVKNVRINRAALLLVKKELSISEIAFNTGFSDQSYFGACFKKQIGMTPTEYVRNKT
jgi:signal transduction histidine kinase/ligand-binding sensor domain-containing protein/DNA-binding response OmpR family regulator